MPADVPAPRDPPCGIYWLPIPTAPIDWTHPPWQCWTWRDQVVVAVVWAVQKAVTELTRFEGLRHSMPW